MKVVAEGGERWVEKKEEKGEGKESKKDTECYKGGRQERSIRAESGSAVVGRIVTSQRLGGKRKEGEKPETEKPTSPL